MPISVNQAATEEQINRAIPATSMKTFVECIAEAVVRKKLEQRPTNWSARSNAPYYKERFAVSIKVIIDEMMKDGEDRMYWYKDSPNIGPDALYSRLCQGRMYLLDKMDPDGKYKIFCETFTISKQKGKGVLLSVNNDVRHNNTILWPSRVEKESVRTWRDEMQEFLESSEKEFDMKKLSLSDDEVLELKATLEPLQGIIYDISNIRIVIKKI